ncbi:TPA: hypothetical protein ACKQHR_001581 [Pseudomonas aeruginosa]|nr:hypothetical protein [Pseudomonas aeruginosa]
MKVLPADIRTAKSLAKKLHRQLKHHPGVSYITLQQCHELYAKSLGYSSWFELSGLLNQPHVTRYLGDLPGSQQAQSEAAIWNRFAALLGLNTEATFALDIARLSGLGYSPQDAAKLKQLSTPWGLAEQVDDVAPGIQRVSTASHGGYRLSAARQRQLQQIAGFTSEWFEEDDEASIVEAAFPDAFDSETASRRLYSTYPELMQQICGATPAAYVQERVERLQEAFQRSPDSWFIVESLGQLRINKEPCFGFYALTGRAALNWFVHGDQNAAKEGKYFMVTLPAYNPYWYPADSIRLGDAVTPVFLDMPAGGEIAPDELSELLGISQPAHSTARFMRQTRTLQALVTGTL